MLINMTHAALVPGTQNITVDGGDRYNLAGLPTEEEELQLEEGEDIEVKVSYHLQYTTVAK